MPFFNLHKVLFSLCIICTLPVTSGAQTEYFVELDNHSGTFNRINKIPGVNWINFGLTTYDEIHHRYFFCGSPDKKQSFLYTIDALTGNVLTSPEFLKFTSPASNILNLQYNEANDTVYAIHWDDIARKEYFVTVDPQTGQFNIIKEIPEVRFVSQTSVLDVNRKEYIFPARDTAGNQFLCVIDIRTGETVRTMPYTMTIFRMAYDKDDDKLYYVYGLPHETQQVGVINRTDGSIEQSFPIEGIFAQLIMGNHSYNRKDKEFILVGANALKEPELLTMNMTTGKISSRVSFPYVKGNGDNVIGFAYDNVLHKIFALNWEPVTGSPPPDKLSVYPNPFSDFINFEFGQTYPEITIFLYDITSRYVGKQVFLNTNKAVVQRTYLSSGVYYAKVYLGNRYFDAVKIHAE